MREILFKGKTKAITGCPYNNGKPDGKWVFGYVFSDLGAMKIRQYETDRPECNDYEVDPETVGQYTGLTDKNSVKIFEGDIIEINHPYAGKFVSEVIWDMDCWSLKDFYFTCFDYPNMAFSEGTEYMKVIGNIHDNPELLEVER